MSGAGTTPTREESTLSPLRHRLGGLTANRAGTAIALVGGPGIGKSHSARRLLAGLPYRSATVHSTCSLVELSAAIPASERLARWSGRAVERGRSGDTLDEGALIDALTARLAAAAPFALLVEDLHEAGTERQGLWADLARRVARSRRLALLATTRGPIGLPFESVQLEPLRDHEIRCLLESQTGAELPAAALAWIARRAAGNPLFALEFFRHLARQGYLWSDTRRWRWREPENDRLPSSIEALIAHRLRQAQLSPAHADLIGAIALLAGELEPVRLPELVELDPSEVARVRSDLEATGVVRDGSFAHPLYREVALQSLKPEARRELAGRVVTLLLDEPMRAAPFVEDAALSSEVALGVLTAAAEEARSLGDRKLAGRLLAQASRHASGSRGDELALQAAAHYRQSNLPTALSLVEGVTSRNPEHSEALFLHAELLVLLGRDEEAERVSERLSMRRELRLSWLRSSLALHAERGDFSGAVAIWRGNADVRAEAPPRTVRTAAFSLQQLGELDDAERIVAEALANRVSMSEAERAELLHVRAAAHYFRGDYQAARADWAEVARLLQGSDERVLRGRALGNQSAACRSMSLFGEAIRLAEEAVEIFAELGLGRDYARQRLNLAALLRSQAEFERSEEILQEIREVFESSGDNGYLIACELEFAFLYFAWEPPYVAPLTLRHAHCALDIARRAALPAMSNQALSVAAWAEARFGNAHHGLALAEEAIALARELGQPQGVGFGTWVRGHVHEALGQVEAAIADFQASARMAENAGNTFHAHDCHLEADRLTGNSESALERLQIFRQHGMKSMESLVCRYFPELATSEREASEPEQLCVDVLGPMRLRLGEEPIEYRARKGRELLARLLEARLLGSGELGQFALQEALYPGLPDDRAGAALQQLVYRLRGALGSQVILRTQDGYALGAVRSDAEAFLESGDGRLWRGPYLAGLGEEWESPVRRSLHAALAEAVDGSLQQQPEESARLARLLLEAEPYELEHLRRLLLAVIASGNEDAAVREYRRARAEFAEVGAELPPTWHEVVDASLLPDSRTNR